MKTRVILDTDIGTDVDDFLALAFVLASPELHLEAVTCVYGDVVLRARIARKLLDISGNPNVPIYCGAAKPLLGLRPIYWPGHEGQGILNVNDPPFNLPNEHAANYIIQAVMQNPGQIHLAAIGPLTTIALALSLEPRLVKNLAGITMMGGALRLNDLSLRYAEHNVLCDPEAAHIVFSSGVPIHMVPLDVTLRTRITHQDMLEIAENKNPFQQVIADQLRRYPFFAENGFTFMHDPLAVASLVDPSLLEWKDVHIDVVLEGRESTGATLANCTIGDLPLNVKAAVDVDSERFQSMLVERISGWMQ